MKIDFRADAYSDIAYAYLGLEDVDETQKYLNYAFEILDNMVKETSEHYYLPCSTLASLLEALQDYENAEHMYLHTARLMTANRYHKNELTVVMFRNKAAEMHSKRK